MENTGVFEYVQSECGASEGSTDTDIDSTAWNEIRSSAGLDEIADLLSSTLEDVQLSRKDIHKVLQKKGAELKWREALRPLESAVTLSVQSTSENNRLLKRVWQCPSCGKEQDAVDIHRKLRKKASLIQDGLPLCDDVRLKCTACGYQCGHLQ